MSEQTARCACCGAYRDDPDRYCEHWPVVAERDRLREALTVVRGLVEPTNGCHAEIRAVVDAALEGPTDA